MYEEKTICRCVDNQHTVTRIPQSKAKRHANEEESILRQRAIRWIVYDGDVNRDDRRYHRIVHRESRDSGTN